MRQICRVDDCDRHLKGYGLCRLHLRRFRSNGTLEAPQPVPLEERFWAKVVKAGPDECWLWTDYLARGYGSIVDHGGRGRILAHRLSAEMAGMQIDGLVVRHTCDNPPCVNPAHLVPGTHQDNADDAAARDRTRFGENQPRSKLTVAQVVDIKMRLARGETHKSIALSHGVCPSTISYIAAGRTWRRVQIDPAEHGPGAGMETA